MVKIRLQRAGAKKSPAYKIVAIDERSKRSGACVDQLGQYQPVSKGAQFTVDEAKVIDWLKKGAQPTVTLLNLFKKQGIWAKYKGAK